jgi:hypothetical protein
MVAAPGIEPGRSANQADMLHYITRPKWSFPGDLNSAVRFTKPTHRRLCLESKLKDVDRIELSMTAFAEQRLTVLATRPKLGAPTENRTLTA